MKRMWIAIGLMAALIAANCLCLFTLTDLKNDFCQRFDELYELSAEGDNEKTAEAARELTELWMEKLHILCRIVRHTQLDYVTLGVARLESLALYGENGELAAEIDRCKILLDDIWDSERPLIRNIF